MLNLILSDPKKKTKNRGGTLNDIIPTNNGRNTYLVCL